MPPFRELPEHQLDDLDDEALIRYIAAARAAGRTDAIKTALGVLVYGHWDGVHFRVLMKVPERDAEEVASRVMLSAISSSFDERTLGQFRSWLSTIVLRRIADYHRAREGDPTLEALPTEHEREDDVWGAEPAEGFAGDALDARRALRQAFGEFNPEHRQVIRLHVLGPHSAAEAARRVPGMTEANVNQIASRFRRRFEELMDAGDTPP